MVLVPMRLKLWQNVGFCTDSPTPRPSAEAVLCKVPRLYINEIHVLILKHWSEGEGPVKILFQEQRLVGTIFLLPF